VDPPDGRVATQLDGSQNVYFRDQTVEVEWAVPHVKTKCIFLIHGLDKGDSEFALRFQGSRQIKKFHVIVEGDNPHDVARDRRRADMRTKAPRELRQLAESHLAIGEQLAKERDFREVNYRQSLLEYARANDAALTLRGLLSKEGTVPQDVADLALRADQAETKARGDYEAFVNREVARYRASLGKDSKFECVEQLRRTLRAIDHECDPRFQRLKLILEESFGVAWNGDGTEACQER
jgi:hypothetical protein